MYRDFLGSDGPDKRAELGLDEKGFRLDGTDAAGADKEAMLRKLYERADANLPPGIGGPVPKRDSETEGAQDEE